MLIFWGHRPIWHRSRCSFCMCRPRLISFRLGSKQLRDCVRFSHEMIFHPLTVTPPIATMTSSLQIPPSTTTSQSSTNNFAFTTISPSVPQVDPTPFPIDVLLHLPNLYKLKVIDYTCKKWVHKLRWSSWDPEWVALCRLLLLLSHLLVWLSLSRISIIMWIKPVQS